MINRENYIEKIKDIKVSEFPSDLKELYDFFNEATEKGTNWVAYDEGDVKFVIDAYFEKLDYFLRHHKAPVVDAEPSEKKMVTRQQSKPTNVTSTPKIKKKAKKIEVPSAPEDTFEFVERIPDEIRFIRRYLNLHDKKKSKDDLLRFINALHRSIIEKKIRKASPYAPQIEYIQKQLVNKYNNMSKAERIGLSPQTIEKMKDAINQEKVMPSVQLIKRYISLNGKYGMKERAKTLMSAIERAYTKGKVLKADKYKDVLEKMFTSLKKYTGSKSQKILNIEQTELNGLSGILGECGCDLKGLDGLSGFATGKAIDDKPLNPVMNSMDFANMRFNTLGFKGKYLEFIGDPSKGFTAMVFGKPKMGKSFLCVDFAGYLARNHGKVLYIAREEGLERTLQDKLKAKDVAHANLFIAEDIPENIGSYDFVFIDSVNKLGLSASDLEALKTHNPETSFIYIFQTTKEGNFRGANEFQHDVDVVIEVPEKGKAIQFGRFNQGGELDIFK